MSLANLERNLGYTFSDRSMLEQALTHPSTRNELHLTYDNQRMEYLGDASLGLAAADFLYREFPDLPEGKMTVMRSSVSSTTTLASLGRSLDIGPYMILGKGEESSGGRNKENNLADTLEAIIGAIYLDGGQGNVEKFFRKHFSPSLNLASLAGQTANPKGVLQEWAQQKGFPCPEYELISEEGPAHQRWFSIRVSIGQLLQGAGSGSTKRAAEADAAARLLENLPKNET